MTRLSEYLEHLRQQIQEQASKVGLGRPHGFPCPRCSREVAVSYRPNGSATLRHPPSECLCYSTQSKKARAELLEAFVFSCRPAHRYGPVEGLETDKPILG